MTEYPNIKLRKYSKPGGKADWFEVAECFMVYYYHGRVFSIPEGYRTDFASVPRWLWSLVPPHGKMANASVVHDFVYDNRVLEQELGPKKARLLADATILWHCVMDGVPTFQAITFFLMVRMFGRKWWVK